MNALFGVDGLVTCDDEVSFDATVDKRRREVFAEGPPAFVEYFDRRLRSLMRENVVAGPGRSTWTNNNCESINHVLKQSVKWQLTQMPDLIDKLRELVEGQYNDADRAMCGLGDYALRPAYAKHRCTTEFWKSMSVDQRRKAAAACFHRPGVSTSTSTDGTLTVPTAPGGSKKPNQVKRARNAKTRSLKRVRLAETGDEDEDS
jgi:type IV secretory pathway VirJ component